MVSGNVNYITFTFPVTSVHMCRRNIKPFNCSVCNFNTHIPTTLSYFIPKFRYSNHCTCCPFFLDHTCPWHKIVKRRSITFCSGHIRSWVNKFGGRICSAPFRSTCTVPFCTVYIDKR